MLKLIKPTTFLMMTG